MMGPAMPTRDEVYEEVVYEEVKEPHVIETGDSVKVKQVLDDATISAVESAGYVANYSWQNLQLRLMVLSCVFAMIAQFFPMPFPSSRPLLAACCAMYFILSSILQFIVSFMDRDTILFTKPTKVRTVDQLSTIQCSHVASELHCTIYIYSAL